MSWWIYPDSRYYYPWYEDENGPSADPRPTDGWIKGTVVDRLRENAYTANCDLKVDVKRGVVILRGVVPSRVAKRSAGDDCWDTVGVVDVSNQLEVAGDGAGTEPGADGDQRHLQVADVMSRPVVTLAGTETCAAAAARMREADIGFLVVTDPTGAPESVLTDRDIVVRCIAGGGIPSSTTASAIATAAPVTLAPEDTIEDAADAMKRYAVRRLPVTSNERVVGVVSLGDLARRRDPASALGEISTAPPTHV